MTICPQWGSEARWIEPTKKRRKEKSEMKIEKVIPSGPCGDEIYLGSLILVLHLQI
jgi:hypothetical protein